MPITLRTLKKKSKQAHAILRKHWPRELDGGTVFLAERGESYHGRVIRCTPGSGDPCLVEGRRCCDCTSHPLKGTPMIGGMSGYYEPEWSEETLFELLHGLVMWGEQPKTATDKEWRRIQAVAGTSPLTENEIAAMVEPEFAPPPPPKTEATDGR